MPKLSIVVPVYNVVEYLSDCVQSILNQSFCDFELILVDDESTDGSREMCIQLGKMDSRIQVILSNNCGVSSARNKGILACNGEFITFVDSDDCLDNSLIFEKCINILEQGFDCVRYNIKTIGEREERVLIKSDSGSFSFVDEHERRSFIKNVLFNYKVGHEVTTAFFRMSIIKTNNIFFPDSINFGEDLFFSIVYSMFSSSMFFVNDLYYRYRIRNNSMMRKSAGKLKLNEMNELSLVFSESFSNLFSPSLFAEIHHLLLFNQLKMFSNYLLIKNFVKIIHSVSSLAHKSHFYRYNKLYYRSFLSENKQKKDYSFYKENNLHKYLASGNVFMFALRTFFFFFFIFIPHFLKDSA